MAAAIESLIVVLLGFFGIGFFLHSMMVGAPTLLTVGGGLGALGLAWAYGMIRAN